MPDIDLRQVVTQYAESMEDSLKFRGVLLDLYPERQYRKQITVLCEIQKLYCQEKTTTDAEASIRLLTIQNQLEADFAYDPSLVSECIGIWKDAFQLDGAVIPDRRKSYRDIKKKRAKEKHPPLSGGGASDDTMSPYTFQGMKYTSKHDLVRGLIGDWENGKKQLFRGILSGFFKSFDPETATICIDAEDMVDEGRDIVFVRLMHRIDPGLTDFCWKRLSYEDLQEFGEDMLNKLRSNDTDDEDLWQEILHNGYPSFYMDCMHEDEQTIAEVKALEARAVELENKPEHAKYLNYYSFAYLVSGERTLCLESNTFESVEELASHMDKLTDISIKDFMQFCNSLIGETNHLDPQLEAWLIALGKNNQLKEWREMVANA